MKTTKLSDRFLNALFAEGRIDLTDEPIRDWRTAAQPAPAPAPKPAYITIECAHPHHGLTFDVQDGATYRAGVAGCGGCRVQLHGAGRLVPDARGRFVTYYAR